MTNKNEYLYDDYSTFVFSFAQYKRIKDVLNSRIKLHFLLVVLVLISRKINVPISDSKITDLEELKFEFNNLCDFRTYNIFKSIQTMYYANIKTSPIGKTLNIKDR